MAHHILDDNNGVIDENADTKNQAKRVHD